MVSYGKRYLVNRETSKKEWYVKAQWYRVEESGLE